ncbi:hypothetical protein MRX96_000354 [Rhipicephalus microplus]
MTKSLGLLNSTMPDLDVLVRESLMKTRSMDGFMRKVVAVNERVICHLADDDRMQLDELNKDCWSLGAALPGHRRRQGRRSPDRQCVTEEVINKANVL